MTDELSDAGEITRKSGSNLAFALKVLPEGCRRDMEVFYASCLVVDDYADEPGLEMGKRREALRYWREGVLAKEDTGGMPLLMLQVRDVFRWYEVDNEMAAEIVRGCEMDLEGAQYRNWEELRGYCYRVASVVGMVSARIFGGINCEGYAENLGLALQLTNILRDCAEDFTEGGRVYLPSEELERYGVQVGSWVKGKPEGWEEFVMFQTERVKWHYDLAVKQLPETQRKVMVAAEMMRAIYGALFDEMARDGVRVWERRYRVSNWRKVKLMFGVYLKGLLG